MKRLLTMFVAMMLLVCTGFAQVKQLSQYEIAHLGQTAVQKDVTPQHHVLPGTIAPTLRAADQLPAVNAKKPAQDNAKVTGNPTWGQTMSYCLDEPYYSSVGAGGSLYWGIKIEAAALVGRNNITDVQLYVSNAGTYNLAIYSGTTPGTASYTETVTATAADEGTWKTIHFATPVPITQNQDLWVTFYNSGVSYPAAGVTGNEWDNGKYISVDGANWNLVSDYNLDYTWMIRVVSDTYPVVAPTVTISGDDVAFTGDTAWFRAVSANATSYSWNYTADLQGASGNTAWAIWNTTGSKTVSVTASNSAGSASATKTVTVYNPSIVNLTNNDNGYMYVWSSTDDGHRVHNTEVDHGISGDTLWVQTATFSPSSSYYGSICPDSVSRLTSLTVDGVNIALDGTNALLEVLDLTSSAGYVIYNYPVVYGSQAHSVSASFGPYYDSTMTTHTITVTNTGGGYLMAAMNGNWGNYTMLDAAGSTQFTGTSADYLVVEGGTILPTSQYYDYLAPASASMVTAILVDGVSQPLDGTGMVEVTDDTVYGFIWYDLDVSFDADHTVQFVFGPYNTNVPPTVSINGPSTVGVGDAATFTATCNDPSATFAWTVDGTAVSGNTTNSLTYTFTAIGSHTVSVTATNSYGSTTATKTVTVSTLYTITITHNGGFVGTSESVVNGSIYAIPSPTSYSGTLPNSLAVWVLSFYDANYAAQLGVSDDAFMLKHIYVDGVELPLGTLESYDEVEYGLTEYVFNVSYDANHTVNIVFGGENTYTVTALSNNETQGVVYGGGQYSDGQTATLMALCQMGMQFAGWSDGSTANPLTFIVTDNVVITANFVPGSGGIIHDTIIIYIHDTVNSGVDQVNLIDIKLYGSNGRIVVEGAEGYDVVLYDAVGRSLATKHDDFGPVYFDVPASGSYMVRVGHYAARRIVVVK